jgi:hypothetical protein
MKKFAIFVHASENEGAKALDKRVHNVQLSAYSRFGVRKLLGG